MKIYFSIHNLCTRFKKIKVLKTGIYKLYNYLKIDNKLKNYFLDKLILIRHLFILQF